jgi:hypothetical protein
MHRKTWNIAEIKRNINQIAIECKSPYNEGFTSFEIKKELYLIKEHIDNILSSCPTFAGEQDWLHEREKELIIKHLKQ